MFVEHIGSRFEGMRGFAQQMFMVYYLYIDYDIDERLCLRLNMLNCWHWSNVLCYCCHAYCSHIDANQILH